MASRVELQSTLEDLLGSNRVYFQPPETVKMEYPCFVYFRNRYDRLSANDTMYKLDRSYQITLITKEPDPPILERIIALKYCRFDRHYCLDNLHHYIYTLYF